MKAVSPTDPNDSLASPTKKDSLLYFRAARTRWRKVPRKAIAPMTPPAPTAKSAMSRKVTSASTNAASVIEMDTTPSTIALPTITAPMNHRDRLLQFYQKYNASKIDSVDSTLASYRGKEDLLFNKLEQKYVTGKKGIMPPTGEGPTCFMDVQIGSNEISRILVKVYQDKTPLAAENFRALCTGEKGNGRTGKPLCFRNCTMHRIVPNFCIQGGDFTKHDGTGGESIYQPGTPDTDMWGKFKDEKPFMAHNRKGLLSMANNGPNRNGSQFFFTLKAIPHLDGKHVVFGEVLEGMDVIEKMATVTTDSKQRPIERVTLSDCGEIRNGTEFRGSSTLQGQGAAFGSTLAIDAQVGVSASDKPSPFAPVSFFRGGTSLTTNASPFNFSATSTPKTLSLALPEANVQQFDPCAGLKASFQSCAVHTNSNKTAKNKTSADSVTRTDLPKPSAISVSNGPKSSQTDILGQSSSTLDGSPCNTTVGGISFVSLGSPFGSTADKILNKPKSTLDFGSVSAFSSSNVLHIPSTPGSGFAPLGGSTDGENGDASSGAASNVKCSMTNPLFGSNVGTISIASKDERESTASPIVSDRDAAETLDDKLGFGIASKVFDTLDPTKTGRLPTSKFEDLVDELGEGFYGDEQDAQLAKVDSGRGYIKRFAFISWYCKLLETSGTGDDGSLDSEEEAERAEEEVKAKSAFSAIASGEGGKSTISISDFGKLMESLGTTYCEEEHRRTLEKLRQPDDSINRDDFISWYMEWLFGDGFSDDEESSEDKDGGLKVEGEVEASISESIPSSTAVPPGGTSSWGNAFEVKKDSWKCEICSVRNSGDVTKCAACETAHPGYATDACEDQDDNALSASGTSIGAGGFTFGAPAPGASPFSFGTTPLTTTPSPVPPSSTTTVPTSGGFSFGAPKPDTSTTSSTISAFSFGAPLADSKKTDEERTFGFSFGVSVAESKKASVVASSGLDSSTGEKSGGFSVVAPVIDSGKSVEGEAPSCIFGKYNAVSKSSTGSSATSRSGNDLISLKGARNICGDASSPEHGSKVSIVSKTINVSGSSTADKKGTNDAAFTANEKPSVHQLNDSFKFEPLSTKDKMVSTRSAIKGWGGIFDTPDSWQCKKCMVTNTAALFVCAACGCNPQGHGGKMEVSNILPKASFSCVALEKSDPNQAKVGFSFDAPKKDAAPITTFGTYSTATFGSKSEGLSLHNKSGKIGAQIPLHLPRKEDVTATDFGMRSSCEPHLNTASGFEIGGLSLGNASDDDSCVSGEEEPFIQANDNVDRVARASEVGKDSKIAERSQVDDKMEGDDSASSYSGGVEVAKFKFQPVSKKDTLAGEGSSSQEWGDIFGSHDSWQCKMCMVMNNTTIVECIACGVDPKGSVINEKANPSFGSDPLGVVSFGNGNSGKAMGGFSFLAPKKDDPLVVAFQGDDASGSKIGVFSFGKDISGNSAALGLKDRLDDAVTESKDIHTRDVSLISTENKEEYMADEAQLETKSAIRGSARTQESQIAFGCSEEKLRDGEEGDAGAEASLSEFESESGRESERESEREFESESESESELEGLSFGNVFDDDSCVSGEEEPFIQANDNVDRVARASEVGKDSKIAERSQVDDKMEGDDSASSYSGGVEVAKFKFQPVSKKDTLAGKGNSGQEWGDIFGSHDSWQCKMCMVRNNNRVSQCEVCKVEQQGKYPRDCSGSGPVEGFTFKAPLHRGAPQLIVGSRSVDKVSDETGNFSFKAPKALAASSADFDSVSNHEPSSGFAFKAPPLGTPPSIEFVSSSKNQSNSEFAFRVADLTKCESNLSSSTAIPEKNLEGATTEKAIDENKE